MPFNWASIEVFVENGLPYYSDKMVFSIVMRDPMRQMLAGDGFVNQLFPNFFSGTPDAMKDFQHSCWSDNYALRHVAGIGPHRNQAYTRADLDKAKRVLEKYSF